jgi:hypothetical protein
MTDVCDWETSKENIQPLKSGRKMDGLKRALAAQPGSSVSATQSVEDQRTATIKYDFRVSAARIPPFRKLIT